MTTHELRFYPRCYGANSITVICDCGWRTQIQSGHSLADLNRLAAQHTGEVTHRCPPENEVMMPCCGLSPFEVPRTDRLTLDPALVTCEGTKRDS